MQEGPVVGTLQFSGPARRAEILLILALLGISLLASFLWDSQHSGGLSEMPTLLPNIK